MPRLESGAWSCSCAARARHAARPGEAAPKADAMQSPSPSAGRAEREASGGAATTWRQHLVQQKLPALRRQKVKEGELVTFCFCCSSYAVQMASLCK